MAAEIISINRGSGERAATPDQERLASALKAATLSPLEDLVANLFANADDMIFDLVGKTGSDEERRSLFEALRTIRLGAKDVRQSFIAQVLRGFSPDADAPATKLEDFDLSTLKLQDAESLEIKIAVDNMATKARSQHLEALRDYELYLQSALKSGLLAINEKSLSPESITSAFRGAFESVQSTIEVKLVVFKLFDRVVVSGLGGIYRAAVAVLEPVAKGLPRPRPKPRLDPEALTGVDAQIDAIINRSQRIFRGAAEAPPQAMAELQSSLNHFFKRNGPGSMAAAEERLMAAQSIIAERLAGVGEESSERAAVERLRLAVCIAALDEDGPLTDPNRLSRVAQILGVGRGDAAAGLASAAGAGAAAAATPNELIDPAQIRQRERDRMIKSVRAEVAREVNGIIQGRVLSLPSVRFVESKLSLLLSIYRARGGGDSPAAIAARDLVVRVIECLIDHQARKEIPEPRRASIEQELKYAFRDIGMDENSALQQIRALDLLLQELVQIDAPAAKGIRAGDNPDQKDDLAARRKGEGAAAGETGPDDADSIGNYLPTVLRPGIWFRVYDALTEQTRWMELESYHVAQGIVSFTGFTGSEHLSLSTRRLVDDLLDGRSETTSTSPETIEALAQIRRITQHRPRSQN